MKLIKGIVYTTQNIILLDNKEYYLEKVWRNAKQDMTKDLKG